MNTRLSQAQGTPTWGDEESSRFFCTWGSEAPLGRACGLRRVLAADPQQSFLGGTLDLRRASSDSDSGSLFVLGKLAHVSYTLISMGKTWTMLLPFSVCGSGIPAEIRVVLCSSNKNKLGASEMQPPGTPWALSHNPPPLLRDYRR